MNLRGRLRHEAVKQVIAVEQRRTEPQDSKPQDSKPQELNRAAEIATYFYRECDTCGRSLRINVKLLGRQLVCPQCRRAFTASDTAADRQLRSQPASLLARADRLLGKFESNVSADVVIRF